jgi:hypothetical protein
VIDSPLLPMDAAIGMNVLPAPGQKHPTIIWIPTKYTTFVPILNHSEYVVQT